MSPKRILRRQGSVDDGKRALAALEVGPSRLRATKGGGLGGEKAYKGLGAQFSRKYGGVWGGKKPLIYFGVRNSPKIRHPKGGTFIGCLHYVEYD